MRRPEVRLAKKAEKEENERMTQLKFADEAEVVAMTGFVHNVSAIVDALCSSSQLSRIHIS